LTEVRARAYAHGRGATEAEIAAAESELGVSFPDSFIEFLRELGWAEMGASGSTDLAPTSHPLWTSCA